MHDHFVWSQEGPRIIISGHNAEIKASKYTKQRVALETLANSFPVGLKFKAYNIWSRKSWKEKQRGRYVLKVTGINSTASGEMINSLCGTEFLLNLKIFR